MSGPRALAPRHQVVIQTLRAQMDLAIAGGDGHEAAARAALDAIGTLGTTYSAKTVPEVQPPDGDAPAAPYWRRGDRGWELVV